MVYKLFIDTNVYLDLFLRRGTEWHLIEAIFDLVPQGSVKLFTSSSSLVNMMYVMEVQKLSKHSIIESVTAILNSTTIVSPDNATFDIAINAGFKDLEDAVQYYTALGIENITYFITLNTKDYKHALPILDVLTPRNFIDIYVADN